MSKRVWILAVLLLALAASPARADFGLAEAEVQYTAKGGGAAEEAGTHPFEQVTSLELNFKDEGVKLVDGALRDLDVTLPEGMAGNPTAAPRCETIDFLSNNGGTSSCSDDTAVGYLRVTFGGGLGILVTTGVPVYNLHPSPGVAAKLGFTVEEVPVTITVGTAPTHPYNITARLSNTSQVLEVFDSRLSVWGVPADPDHDALRGHCVSTLDGSSTGNCPSNAQLRPFLTMPRSCGGALPTRLEALSWWSGDPESPGPAQSFAQTVFSAPMRECAKLGFAAAMDAAPTSDRAESPSGLEVSFEIDDPGLGNPAGTAHSDIDKAVLTLPEGITANPSLAEGLSACSPADLDREKVDSAPGQGCPGASKIGTVQATSPLLEGRLLQGSLYIATPDDPASTQPGAENPFDTLLALYAVVREPELGLIFTQAGKIEPDPQNGRLITTFDDLPPYPIGTLTARLREGGRSPLITPPGCGSYEIAAELTPSGNPAETLALSSGFEISKGVDGGPCPPAGPPPFEPGLAAGTLNNAAAAHSPFAMRLTRRDGDQDLVRFDAVLPPGLTAKLAGVPWCPDAAIAAARGRDGKDELRSPSCPAASQIGAVQGGAGVGSQLTYVPGKVYLAGPVGGAPLSVVGVVPAVAGPFDVGTIVVRQALDLDPITGQAKVLSAASDDLPHILAGIPLKVRDIQVSVDRPNFTLNPTNCSPMAVLAGIWGGGSDLFSGHDDFPVLRSARFQAADCAALGFKPRLAIKLRGGVRRGAHPALRAHVVPRPGDANFSRAVVTLPRSAFLDQAHIRTICTRVQFAAGAGNGAACPPGAVYGKARAWSPLLDAPAVGPVFLRSSDNNLPDLVVALKGPASAPVEVELSARIDSVRGGIRSTFAGIPDLPVSRFILDMQGGKKGLIVNSRNLCHKPARNRAKANIAGQNGRVSKTRPRVVALTCAKRRKAKRARAKRSAGSVSRASAVG